MSIPSHQRVGSVATTVEITVNADLIVIGAGMAGMTAAAFASRQGFEVLVVEKGPAIGGSAALTSGGLLRPRSAADLVAVNPSGDPALAVLLTEEYDKAIEWIESLGVSVTGPNSMIEDVMGYPTLLRACDILTYLDRCRSTVAGSGGWIVPNCQVQRLLLEGGAVVGALVEDDSGLSTINSRWTLLATGGFQNDADLRRRYLGEAAVHMEIRSNPYSAGDGLRLGTAVGAALSEHMSRFYGHTVPWPLDGGLTPADFVPLSQPFLNAHAILIDQEGRRFTDESAGPFSNANAVLHLPRSRAVLIADQRIRDEDTSGGRAPPRWGMSKLIDRTMQPSAAPTSQRRRRWPSLTSLSDLGATRASNKP